MELPEIIIDGTIVRLPGSNRKRYKITIGGQDLFVQGAVFWLLALLALVRYKPHLLGWIHKSELYPNHPDPAKPIHHARIHVREQIPELDWPVIENDRHGYYRLATLPDRIRFSNPAALIEFGDATIIERYLRSR